MKNLIFTILTLFSINYSLNACTCALTFDYCTALQGFTYSPVIIKGVKIPNQHGGSIGTRIKVLDHISGNEKRDTLSLYSDSVLLWSCVYDPFYSGDTIIAILDPAPQSSGEYQVSLCSPILTFKNDSVFGVISINMVCTTDSVFPYWNWICMDTINELPYNNFKQLPCVQQAASLSNNDNIKPDVKLALFPNPASDKAMVHIEGTNIYSESTLEIVDLFGKRMEVEAVKNTDSEFLLPIGNLAAGVYFVNFKSGEYTLSKKLIVSK